MQDKKVRHAVMQPDEMAVMKEQADSPQRIGLFSLLLLSLLLLFVQLLWGSHLML